MRTCGKPFNRLRESGSGDVQLRWVPSQLNAHGNDEADALALLEPASKQIAPAVQEATQQS